MIPTSTQHYLRIPGLTFEEIPTLIPEEHIAALMFLRPDDFPLDLPWKTYYELLVPFQNVAHKLIDVFEACIGAFRDSVERHTPLSGDGRPSCRETSLPLFWERIFERVLGLLGHEAAETGMKVDDVAWVVYLYTNAWAITTREVRKRKRDWWRHGNVRYLHDLLRDWSRALEEHDLDWTVMFGRLFTHEKGM
ncbi:hypothetical protein CCHL11_09137 [Colletotrichum chlorophyti]|uniref:Uncharacterized protein n=1 Tax=Colletotrichum chlorophyti TaxID=708187 RepID=A0A1Q8RT31_9PEZI|nr:hypothetical protein CCHL11_09137 [Colletotrichum chlorophyti]